MTFKTIVYSSDTFVPEQVKIITALTVLNQYIGAKYLLEAVAKPDSQISYTNLRNLFNPYRQEEYVDEDIDVQVPLFQFNYSISPEYETPVQILDDKAVKQYKQRLIKIMEYIAERQSLNDDAYIDDLIEERDFIVSELTKAHNRFGRLRTFTTQNLRDRQSVSKAIRETVARLRDLDPELGRICDRHLVLKTYVSWRSEALNKLGL